MNGQGDSNNRGEHVVSFHATARRSAALMTRGCCVEIGGVAYTVWLTHADELRVALREAIASMGEFQ